MGGAIISWGGYNGKDPKNCYSLILTKSPDLGNNILFGLQKLITSTDFGPSGFIIHRKILQNKAILIFTRLLAKNTIQKA